MSRLKVSTLTAKILGTMFLNGATLEECVETIVQTLPICQTRQVAYATFSILQIFNNGEVYLVEYDNPRCIFLRCGHVVELQKYKRLVKDKEISECRFQVQKGDALVLVSDGVTHAGVGKSGKYKFGWPWESVAEFVSEQCLTSLSSARMAAALCAECSQIYEGKPGDDTTVVVARIIDRKPVNLMTGPPLDRNDDETITADFAGAGTTAAGINGLQRPGYSADRFYGRHRSGDGGSPDAAESDRTSETLSDRMRFKF